MYSLQNTDHQFSIQKERKNQANWIHQEGRIHFDYLPYTFYGANGQGIRISVPKDNHKIVGLEVLVSLLFLCLSHYLA